MPRTSKATKAAAPVPAPTAGAAAPAVPAPKAGTGAAQDAGASDSSSIKSTKSSRSNANVNLLLKSLKSLGISLSLEQLNQALNLHNLKISRSRTSVSDPDAPKRTSGYILFGQSLRASRADVILTVQDIATAWKTADKNVFNDRAKSHNDALPKPESKEVDASDSVSDVSASGRKLSASEIYASKHEADIISLMASDGLNRRDAKRKFLDEHWQDFDPDCKTAYGKRSKP